MRFSTYALGLALLAWTTSAQAISTLNFGTPVDSTTVTTCTGASGDISCTHSVSVTNGANDATASAAVIGQVSADHGITTNPTAIGDQTITYTIPYTVTRSWSTTTGPTPQLIIPNQTITLNLNYGGEVSKDNSQTTGGLGQALASGASVTSARFGAVTLGVQRTQTGGGGLARTAFNDTVPDITGTAGRTFDGSAGEISFVAQIPTNYRDWTDIVAPNLYPTYNWNSTAYSGTQSFTDTLTISFRLRAESRPSGSVSVTGGEALACAGQTSPLGSFVLDNSASCDSGLTIAASVTETGTTSSLVPEPGTLALIGSGLGALVAYGTRRRS